MVVKTVNSVRLTEGEADELTALIEDLKEKQGIVFTSFKEVFSHLVNECQHSLNTCNLLKTEENKVETVEVEKIVNVPVELQENEFIVNLNKDQLEVANHIRENRFREESKTNQDATLDSFENLFKKVFYNKGTLYNYGGNFWTGL